MLIPRVPEIRIRSLNGEQPNPSGKHVVYWMVANRRTSDNFALDRAVETALRFDRPLVVLEALRIGYPYASDRLHQFVMQGMRDNAQALAGTRVRYYPYVERRAGEARGLLAALGKSAVAVVTDDHPGFFLPRMLQSAAREVPVLMEAVDASGLLPLRAPGRAFSRAVDFRRHLQAILPDHIDAFPATDPARHPRLRRMALPREVSTRWPEVTRAELLDPSRVVSALAIDHLVAPADEVGGSSAATRRLRAFIDDRLPSYGARQDATCSSSSGLSPYLHFGHLSVHSVFKRLSDAEAWSPSRLSGRGRGQRAGYWGMSEPAESFLDELVVWRELGFGTAWYVDRHDRYEALPEWARRTLDEHASDPRPHLYSPSRLAGAETHDAVWNAAQRQLVSTGRLHSYLRMLWGKKIVEWSESPRIALEVMSTLNDRYALDGRDPNSVSGVFWCLGRYDRPWGPERPVFGKVRYMSSDATRRKLPLESYLRRYAA